MVQTLHLRSLLAVGVSSVALIGAAPALAQSVPATAQAGTAVGEIVVTAERRTESLQSTPVAVSAFTAQALKVQRLDGGQNLEISIPNANYSRSEFGGYNFNIRGVGSQVTGEGGTSGVSFNVNELPVSDNHFGDTDFYDVQRVEVLRGPQGTLYGRNATGGAINVITNQPTSVFEGSITAEYGNYNARKLTGFINLPLGDAFALRLAGFGLQRDGFGTNVENGDNIDGRNLGAGRATLSFKPNDRFSAYLMYEHYGEDDDRNRVGKQLCITDNGPASVGGFATDAADREFLSQGCKAGSLYSSAAYGVVNSDGTLPGVLGNVLGLTSGNVYAGHPLQNTNLNDIEAAVDPRYVGKEDLAELHMAWNVTDKLTLTSITGLNHTSNWTQEDYDRAEPTTAFNTTPDPTALIPQELAGTPFAGLYPALYASLFPGGYVSDPQTGTSNKLVSFDYNNDDSEEITQELRLTSSFKGPLNFSAGLFYSRNRITENNYYVESNILDAGAQINDALYSNIDAALLGMGYPAAAAAAAASGATPFGGPITIDTGSPPSGVGHNYYDSRTTSDLQSSAAFGELYWDVTPDVKLTVGARYTVDDLSTTIYPIPLLAPGGGFPALAPSSNTWRAVTGRVNLDWTPTLSFTDKTLLYANYSRGYKGGGFNTPCQTDLGVSSATTCGYSPTYQPEFIDAFELGAKNVLAGGSLTLDADAFYYNYRNYQVSKIVAEASVNENINARIYGVEFEGVWSPIRHLTFNTNVGYLHTEITGGDSIDELNLTGGNPNYTLLKNSSGGNCIVDTAGLSQLVGTALGGGALTELCQTSQLNSGASLAPGVTLSSNPTIAQNQMAQANYLAFLRGLNASGALPSSKLSMLTPLVGDGTAGNPGALYQYGPNASINGVSTSLKGKQLPNSPDWTISFGAQYVWDLAGDWKATLRGDYYWQDQSYARIYNTEADLLKAWTNVNATLSFDKSEWGLSAQLWVKNAFNSQPITDTYLGDATVGLSTNTFTLDPRTYGLTLTKSF